MNISNNKIFYSVVAVVAIVLASFFVWFLRSSGPMSDTHANPVGSGNIVQIGATKINVELATTAAQQIRGLSGRNSLAPNTGMFFVFNNPGSCAIWMKDMNFPIDVLWLTSDLKINYIVENMSPASYPQSYVSPTPARYVLEVPAGTVRADGITVGQDAVLK